MNKEYIYFKMSDFRVLVEITEKPLHVSDNSIGFYKSIHFVFEIGYSFRNYRTL